MPRPVDPVKYSARRASIIDAASRQFALHGFNRATTAGICRDAAISSGTFFHYFPTKLDVLMAVLEAGCADLKARLADLEQEASGLAAIEHHATSSETEMAEESFAVFVSGLAGVESDPRVAAAFEEEAELVAGFLIRNVRIGQDAGEIRTDVPPAKLATWVLWLIDGAAQAAVTGQGPDDSQLRHAVRVLVTNRA